MKEGRMEMKTVGMIKKMEDVTQEEPTTTLPHFIVKNGFKALPPGHSQNEIGKINP